MVVKVVIPKSVYAAIKVLGRFHQSGDSSGPRTWRWKPSPIPAPFFLPFSCFSFKSILPIHVSSSSFKAIYPIHVIQFRDPFVVWTGSLIELLTLRCSTWFPPRWATHISHVPPHYVVQLDWTTHIPHTLAQTVGVSTYSTLWSATSQGASAPDKSKFWLGGVARGPIKGHKHGITCSLLLPAMVFGCWISTTKIDKQNLVTSLFSLCYNRFIQAVLVGLLGLPSRHRDCHGQHSHGGAILPNSRKMQLDNNLQW
jgi:hypothetical protein